MNTTEIQTSEAFHITDEASANWYLRKLANIEAEKIRVKAQADKMIAELETDKNGLKFMYEGELQEWVRRELARKGGRKKTLHLLQGSCAFRSVPASIKVADPVAALEFVRVTGLQTTRIMLAVDDYRFHAIEHLEKTGELLPGIERTEERESFSVKHGGKESKENTDPA